MKNFKIGLLAFYTMSFGLVFAGPACSKSSTPLKTALKPEMIDVSGLSKAELYCRLFNDVYNEGHKISLEQAQKVVGDESRKPLFVDLAIYSSKALLIDISGDKIDVSRYNQRFGPEKAQSVVFVMRLPDGTEYFEHE